MLLLTFLFILKIVPFSLSATLNDFYSDEEIRQLTFAKHEENGSAKICWIETTTLHFYSNDTNFGYVRYSISLEVAPTEENKKVDEPVEKYEITHPDGDSKILDFVTVGKNKDDVVKQNKTFVCKSEKSYTKTVIEGKKKKMFEISIKPIDEKITQVERKTEDQFEPRFFGFHNLGFSGTEDYNEVTYEGQTVDPNSGVTKPESKSSDAKRLKLKCSKNKKVTTKLTINFSDDAGDIYNIEKVIEIDLDEPLTDDNSDFDSDFTLLMRQYFSDTLYKHKLCASPRKFVPNDQQLYIDPELGTYYSFQPRIKPRSFDTFFSTLDSWKTAIVNGTTAFKDRITTGAKNIKEKIKNKFF